MIITLTDGFHASYRAGLGGTVDESSAHIPGTQSQTFDIGKVCGLVKTGLQGPWPPLYVTVHFS